MRKDNIFDPNDSLLEILAETRQRELEEKIRLINTLDGIKNALEDINLTLKSLKRY